MLGINYPKLEYKEDIFGAIKKVAYVARALSGLIHTGEWFDKEGDRIIMMSLWESEELAFNASQTLRPLITQYPWTEWERKPGESFLGLKQVV